MAYSLSPWPRVRFEDENGNPLAGGKLYTSLNNTDDPKSTYSDADGTPNTNPVILDAEGYADIWLDSDYPYRFKLTAADDTLIWQRDDVTGNNAGNQSVRTIADLRNLGGAAYGQLVTVLGYWAAGDNGGGDFWFDAVSTAADNGGTIIQVTGVPTGRWKRVNTSAINVRWFGAKGDNSTDDSLIFQDVVTYCVTNGLAVYVPAGEFVMGPLSPNITATLGNGQSLVMYGDGPDVSIIRESANKGGDTGATACKMLYITATGTNVAESVTVRDMTFDKNGANTPLPSPDTKYELAHTIAINIKNTAVLRNAWFENLVMLDRIGGHIVLAEGRINSAVIIGCHARNANYTGSPRGDIEFQACVQNLSIDGCTGYFLQSEPNVSSPLDGIPTLATITACRFDILDIGGFSADNTGMRVNTISTYALNTVFYDALVTVRNSTIGVATTYTSGSSTRWFRLAQGSSISDSLIRVRVDAGALSPWYFDGSKTTFGMYLNVVNCRIEGDDDMTASVTGYAIQSPALYSGALPFRVSFINCEFDDRFDSVIDAHRNGIFEFSGCKLAAAVNFARIGSSSPNYGKVTFENCDMSGLVGRLADFEAPDTLLGFVVNGDHPYSKFSIAVNSGTIANVASGSDINGRWYAASAPSAAGLVGMRVYLPEAAYGTPSEYTATTNSASASTWRQSGQAGVSKNTTANRPTLAATDIGVVYMDTTLDADGKPIWYNGTAWVDATGAVV